MITRSVLCSAVLATSLVMVPSKQSLAGADPFIGEVMWVGFTFCPRGWASADGQLLLIRENTALFSLYGTVYGGDGRTTFALPDLRGRVPLHSGSGPGLSNYTAGSRGGQETVTLTISELPSHSHAINASRGATRKGPNGRILGRPKRKAYDIPANASAVLASSAVNDAGGSTEHENRPPFLSLRACIALVGTFPSRN